MSDSTALVNGREVTITGPQAHPFRCAECSSCFRQHRHAARCCKMGSEDLRSGETRDFCPIFEEAQIVADEVRYEETMRMCHYECSCGESFARIEDAKMCKKCRVYTAEGFCTEVFDRAQDHKVVWSMPARDRSAAPTHEVTPLTHNPFKGLKL